MAVIIGAGPIGSYLAQEMARQHDTTLVEEHSTIGAPVQCTGILTDSIRQHIKDSELKKITKATVTQTVIHGPNTQAELDIQPNYVIDNIAHCQMLANKASDRGATILTKHRYHSNNTKVTLKGTQTSIKTDLLIGADGPTSTVAKNNQLYDKKEFLTAIQSVMRIDDYDDRIHFYPHIGEYAWYCPEGEGKARIGIASRTNARTTFDHFIKNFKGEELERQGGPIPLFKPKLNLQTKTKHMTVQLAGDAVPFIKNTTGGGIIPGTSAAHIQAQDPTQYVKGITPLRKELMTHYLLNKAMIKFTHKDWDRLVTQVQDDRIQTILKKTNRDNAFSMASQLLVTKPKLLRWALKFIK